MDPANIQQLEGLARIKEEFTSYLLTIHQEIIAADVDIKALKLYLEDLLPKSDFQKANTVDEIFDLLKKIYLFEQTSFYFLNMKLYKKNFFRMKRMKI